jgi:1,4-dihydroxy-6-naphthoate synthase
LYPVVDLGVWWEAETGLPLPLGVNVIRRALGAPLVARASAVLRASIAWALAHRGQIIEEIAGEDRGDPSLSRPALIDEYLGLYANQDTLALAEDTRQAVDALFARARAAGLMSFDAPVDWAP